MNFLKNSMFLKPEVYKIILDNSIVITVDVIFVNGKGEILLGLRNNEPLKWVYYIPGGRRFKGETINEWVSRKMKEELWLDIDTEKLFLLSVYDDIFDNSAFEGIETHTCSITYVYHLSENEEKNIWISDSQHCGIKFFDINDPNLHDLVKIRVKDMKEKGVI